jgi:hypothetical protein
MGSIARGAGIKKPLKISGLKEDRAEGSGIEPFSTVLSKIQHLTY